MATFNSAVATGTWTPTVLGGAGVVKGHTYSQQTGTYIRIGNNVFVHGQVVVSALGTIDGSVLVMGGLPFPIRTDSTYRPVACIRPSGITFTGVPTGTGTNSTSYISLSATASGGATTNLIDSALAASSSFSVFMMYETS